MNHTFNIEKSTLVINNVSDSFNKSSNCSLNNTLELGGSPGVKSKAAKHRTNISNEEFCSVWTRYHEEGLAKISEVLNVSPKWAWVRYLCLTNNYNNVQLPVCRNGHPDPVDAESLNAIIATTMHEA